MDEKDLEQLNAEYIKLNNTKEEKEKQLKNYENELNSLEPENEKRKNELGLMLNALKTEIEGLEKGIEGLKEQISQDPEMKKYMDQAMQKRLSRSVKKLSTEKEKLETIQKMVTKHKTAGNFIKGMMSNTKEIKKLEDTVKDLKAQLDELKVEGKDDEYTDPEKAKEILGLIEQTEGELEGKKNKLQTNTKSLQDFLEKHKNEYNISMKDIEELLLNVNTKGTDLDKIIAGQIEGKEKDIKNREIALGNLTPQAEHGENESDEEPKKKEGWFRRNVINRGKNVVNKVKNFFKKGKQPALKEADIESETEASSTSTVEVGDKGEEPTFRETIEDKEATAEINAGKYVIVRDTMSDRETKSLKQASHERREQEKAEQEKAEEEQEESESR